MKPAVRKALKNLLTFLVIAAVSALFIWVPQVYVKKRLGLASNYVATCANEQAGGHVSSTVKDAALGNVKTTAEVKLTGRLSYLSSRDAYVLRDGAFSLPLDLSDCRKIVDLKGAEVPVFVKGAVYRENDEPALAVDGIRLDYPIWAQDMASAGVIGIMAVSGGLVGLVLVGFFKGLGWLLTAIGIRQPKKKEELAPDKIKAAKAGRSILTAIFAPLVWYINPFLGALYHATGLYNGWRGLKSPKRTVAIVGLTLCGAGLVTVPVVFAALGVFSKPSQPNFAREIIIDNFAKSKEEPSTTLETRRYRNEKLGFSIRLPKGWIADDSGKFGPPVVFFSPQEDKIDGKPFKANIIFVSGPLEGHTIEEGRQIVKTEQEKAFKDFKVTDEGAVTFDEKTVGLSLGVVGASGGVRLRIFSLFAAGGDQGYVLTATALDSTWDRYETAVKDSLATFRVKK